MGFHTKKPDFGCSGAVVLLLLIYCLMYFPLFVGVLCLSLFCCALLWVRSSFAIFLKGKGKLVALLLMSYRCIVTINVLWLFFKVPWVGLQCVIVVFCDHAPFLFHIQKAQTSLLNYAVYSAPFLFTLWEVLLVTDKISRS